jgi:GTP-binding protein Era
MHQAGVVAVVGRPNVGKSTLINTLVGHKVSIVSDKPQTTRRRVLGILTTDDYQIVFVDTPGVHKPHTKLGSALNESAKTSMFNVDIVLAMVDVSRMPSPEDEKVADMLRQAGYLDENRKVPVLLCMNKMDKLKAADVERNWEAYNTLFNTKDSVMTSFTKNQNVDILVGEILQRLPENPNFYPDDLYTDQPLRFLAAELVREKALRLTKQEVPHAVATIVQNWEEDEKEAEISIDIIIERDSQKGILIGKKGSMLKEIGTEARLEMQELLEKKVYLNLYVKVREGWRQNPRLLKELEYLD